MKTKTIPFVIACFLLACAVSDDVYTAQKIIKLASPDTNGGIPLMQALSKRHSSRSYSDRALSDQALSGLLWAANGVNRPDTGKRTAPSALDRQEVDVYVALKDGLYLYNAKKHRLELVVEKDLRELTGMQDFVKNAALNLVYVADLDKSAGEDEKEKMLYAYADAAFIGQNVYLYCASAGLETVIRAFIDRNALSSAMKLRKGQRVILAQTVGYPEK